MIREIIMPEKEQLIINIPKAYVNKKVEVLVFPIAGMGNKKSIESDVNEELKEFQHIMAQFEELDIRVPDDIDIDDMIDEMSDDIY